mmetsp:Transcript_9581/g.13386  ORF Transcript_9581/g.13386 Transcript_9581/m.13386 type:complete len:197 (+) Transcript_9581:26-616(+)
MVSDSPVLGFLLCLLIHCGASVVARPSRTGVPALLRVPMRRHSPRRQRERLLRLGSVVNLKGRSPRLDPCKCATAEIGGVISAEEAGIIDITENAVKRITEIKASRGDAEVYFRVGVKSGGCSGMSYTMEIVPGDEIEKDDTVVQYNGFMCVIDPKSLLYLFGMTLDYSDELIGGGFKFFNPNAKDTCGCGSSFGV